MNQFQNVPGASQDAFDTLNSNLAKLDSDQNYTNDILTDAVSCSRTTFFSGNGSSYTGTVPDGNMKYGVFIVLVRGTRKYVLAISTTGALYTNHYTGSAWTGWVTFTYS